MVHCSLQPGCDEQREKLRSIVANLEQQQASYVNLLNLVTVRRKTTLFKAVNVALVFVAQL